MPPTDNVFPDHYSNDDRTPGFDLTIGAAYTVISAITGLIWSVLFLAIRTYLRIFVNGPFGWDDYACGMATIFACLSSAFALGQVHYGLGEHIGALDLHAQDMIRVMSYVNSIFLVSTLAFSMLSICMLIKRITSSYEQVRISLGVSSAVCLWATVSTLIIAFQCAMPRPWRQGQGHGCMSTWRVWQGIAITQAVLEFANVVAALVLVWPLSMPLRTKSAVMVAFSIRLLIIPPTIMRLNLLHHIATQPDWTHERAPLVTITQIVLHFSVILATIPCVKPWLTALQGGGFEMTVLTRPHIPELAHRGTMNIAPMSSRQKVHAHRKESVDEWQRIVMGDTSASTTIRFSPQDAWLAARRRSADSSQHGLKSITRMDSFSVTVDDGGGSGGQRGESTKDADLPVLSVVPETSWESLRRGAV